MSNFTQPKNDDPHPGGRVMHLVGIAAAGVFASVLLMASMIISGSNLGEISAPLLFTGYFLAASLGLVLLFLGLFWLLPFRIAKLIAVVIASYALVSLSLDAAFPVGIGELEEGMESARAAPLWWSMVQVVGTACIAWVIWKLPLTLAGSIGWAMVAVIVVSTLVPVIGQSLTSQRSGPTATATENPPPYNIYHVVFDAYYGPWLGWAIEQLDMEAGTFAGFTHYQAARANYWATVDSYTSFMSGRAYSPGRTISSWHSRAEQDSLVSDLQQAGFRTYFAGLATRPGLAGVEWRDTQSSPLLTEAFLGSDFPLIADLWLARSAPVALRHVLFDGGRGLVSTVFGKVADEPAGDTRTYRSYHQYRRMLEAEETRPAEGAYVHIHVYPPHPPWQLDRTGRYVGESDYEEQLLLATNMMEMLISRLKSLSRFDQNLIVLQSDHGLTIPGRTHRFPRDSGRSFITIDDETAERIGRINFRSVNGRTLDARFGALLMVKPPLFCEDDPGGVLKVDQALVQLQDIRRFLNGVIETDTRDCEFPRREFVDVHVGTRRQKGPDGKMLKVGSDLRTGEFNVLRVHADGQWEILPNRRFEY